MWDSLVCLDCLNLKFLNFKDCSFNFMNFKVCGSNPIVEIL
jgi:hypothetical protein